VLHNVTSSRRQLYKDHVSAYETPAQHPIYWAPTFDDAVQYLPRCRGFETAFGFGTEDPELFFVVDWDPHVYYDRFVPHFSFSSSNFPQLRS
jgi:hypothetical protein